MAGGRNPLDEFSACYFIVDISKDATLRFNDPVQGPNISTAGIGHRQHCEVMARRVVRSVDRRFSRSPRDYFETPAAFGRVLDTGVIAADDLVAADLAWVWHCVVVGWRARTGRGGQVELARRLKVSTSTVSEVLSGRRWPNATIVLGVLVMLHTTGPARRRS